MTKQEEIREDLEKLYKAGILTPVNVLFLLDKQGVVIKVDKKFPQDAYPEDIISQDDIKAGRCIFIEPLIKERE